MTTEKTTRDLLHNIGGTWFFRMWFLENLLESRTNRKAWQIWRSTGSSTAEWSTVSSMSVPRKEVTASYSQAAQALLQRSQYILDPRDDFNPFKVPTEEKIIMPHTNLQKHGSYQVSLSPRKDVNKQERDLTYRYISSQQQKLVDT